MKIKPHQKIRITARMIQNLGACSDGVRDAKKILPLVISTDPDKNIRAAEKILSFKAANPYSSVSATWPWENQNNGAYEDFVAYRYQFRDHLRNAHSQLTGHSGDDEWLPERRMDAAPQMLAAMADSLLTRKAVRPYRER